MRNLLLAICLSTLNSAFSQPITITYLGNEGIFIQGERTYLIDALFDEDFGMYQKVPDTIQSKIIAGVKPFEHIDYFLVSHKHDDHYNKDLVNDFLQNHPETTFISSNQVVDELTEYSERCIVFKGEMNAEFKSIVSTEIRASWIRHPHRHNYQTINLVFIIEDRGKRIVHFGDTEFQDSNFEQLNLNEFKLDLALVPIWFLIGENPGKRLGKVIGAQSYIGIHAPMDFDNKWRFFNSPLQKVHLNK